jgi:site-specific recombinase XerD
MIKDIPARASVPAKLESGPLGRYLPDLAARLSAQGYAAYTIQRYLHTTDVFGRWLNAHQLPLSSIDEDTLNKYISSLDRQKSRSMPNGSFPVNAVGLKHLLQLLRELNIIRPRPALIPTSPAEQILSEYDQYLDRTLGAALSTRRGYLYFARQFLTYAFRSGDLQWWAVCAESVAQFVQEEAAQRKGHGRKTPGQAMRAFLRYLVLRGFLPAGLDAAVPVIRVWTHASLPGHLSAEEIARLLAVSSDGSAIGKRNYAILILLSRLGIRALEVARLRLDDINWPEGSVQIRAGKSHRERLLPLPEDVGQALLDYLRHGRPTTRYRELFLEHAAPYQPLRTASAITHLVQRLLKKAGIERRSSGAHLFRHTAASQLVNRGASFKEIADILGHRSLQTTGIYAKLDLEALSRVALPWPGGGQ